MQRGQAGLPGRAAPSGSRSRRVQDGDRGAGGLVATRAVGVGDPRRDPARGRRARHVVAAARVMDEGGRSGVEERGSLVSFFAEAKLGDSGIILSESGSGGGAYNQRINGLLPGEKYYIRAYATNAEGTAYGSSLRFETMINEQAPSWSRAKKSMVGQGWWTSPWFGSFNLKDESGWLYHEQLAWAYAMPASGGGVWLWTQATGWAWTEEGIYPFLHSHDSQSWLYFYGKSKDQILFYRYSDSRWMVKPRISENN